MSKVIRQWSPQNNDENILYLDEEIPRDKVYSKYRIEGQIYEPIQMSHTGGKCIGIKGEGNFVGKEIELI